MKKFFALYHFREEVIKSMLSVGPEQQKSGMQKRFNWKSENEKKLLSLEHQFLEQSHISGKKPYRKGAHLQTKRINRYQKTLCDVNRLTYSRGRQILRVPQW